jgi:hypothetical protein
MDRGGWATALRGENFSGSIQFCRAFSRNSRREARQCCTALGSWFGENRIVTLFKECAVILRPLVSRRFALIRNRR